MGSDMGSGISSTRRRIASTIVTGVFLACLATIAPAMAQSGLAAPKDAAEVFVKATAAGDADAIAALYASDAILLPPGAPPISGRNAIKAVFARNFAAGANTIAFTSVRSDVGQDRAAVFWQWQSEIKPASGEVIKSVGQSLVYFKRVDGVWLISADMLHIRRAQ